MPTWAWSIGYPEQGRGELRETDGAWIPDPLPIECQAIAPHGFPPGDDPETYPLRFEVRAVISLVDGKWEPVDVGLRIRKMWGSTLVPITVGRWAELDRILPSLITTAITGYGSAPEFYGGTTAVEDGHVRTSLGPGPATADPKGFAAATRRRQKRRWMTPELLIETAQIYAASSKPLKAVSAHFHVSEAQASRYIRAAKDDGLITTKPKD